MFLKKVSKNLNQTFTVGKNIVSGKYPSFVYRNILNENEIPVFCLHSATPGSFETMLRYLKENGYHTLSIDEFYQILINKKEKKTGRSILLTFDDGMGSVWSIAYPLLKKYGFKATVFLVPGRIKYRNKYYPNLEDVWVGTANMQEVLERDHSDQPFSTWEEVKTMHESGAFDFESHTFDHSLIFTSPEIVDFVNPAILSRYHLFEFPRIRCGEKEGQAQDLIRPGTPLYTTSSRMSDSPRYIDDSRFRRECIRYVEENGGEEFFKEEQWRRKLFQIMKKYGKNGLRGRYETKEEQIKAITFELDKSRKLIEEHLPGKTVRHLAYPWGVGSILSLKISREIGYITNFWERIGNNLKVTIGQDPLRITRIGEDFFYLLPGMGRITLTQILLKKALKRFKEGSPYLSH